VSQTSAKLSAALFVYEHMKVEEKKKCSNFIRHNYMSDNANRQKIKRKPAGIKAT